MPADSGKYPVKSPRALQDSIGRYIGVVSQGPAAGDVAKPIHPVDLNDAQQIFINYARTLGIVSGNGASDRLGQLLKPLNFTSSYPKFLGISGGTTGFAEGDVFMVSGLPVYLGEGDAGYFNWDSTSTSVYPYIHRVAATVAGTVITDPTLRLVTNILGGVVADRTSARSVKFMQNNGAWSAGFDVATNTASTITLASGPTLGTVGATVPATGATYRIETNAPNTSTTDYMWLDCWIEEIAAVATAADPIVDSSLNLNVQGTTMETTRRWQLRSALFLEHASIGTLSNYVAVAGGITATGDTGVYTYTDSSGLKHWVCAVASYDRTTGDAGTVLPSYVSDLRPLAGRARDYNLYQVAKHGGGNGIVSGLTATKVGTDYVLAAGEYLLNGRYRVLETGVTFTGVTDGLGVTWAGTADGTYYAYIDQYGRPQIAASSPGASAFLLDRLTVATGALKAFTSGTFYEDLRVYVDSVAGAFRPNAAGYLAKDISLQQTPADGTGSRSIIMYDKDGVAVGQLECSDATNTLSLSTVDPYTARLGTAAAGHDVGTAGGNSLVTHVGDGWVISGAGATVNAATGTPPDVWEFTDTRHNMLTGPGVKFGTAAGPVVLSKTFIIPASDGQICVPGTYGAAYEQYSPYFTGISAFFPVVWNSYYNPYHTVAGTPDHTLCLMTIPLGVPYGAALSSAVLNYTNNLSGGAGTVTLRVGSFYVDDLAAGPVMSAPTNFVLDGAGPTGALTQSFGVATAGAHRRHYMGLWIQSATAPAGNFSIQGITATITFSGVGNPTIAAGLALPFEGLTSA